MISNKPNYIVHQ